MSLLLALTEPVARQSCNHQYDSASGQKSRISHCRVAVFDTTRTFSPYLYRARNRVERFFNRIKQCRRVATRYDRLVANYLALVQLASIRLWLRLNESAS